MTAALDVDFEFDDRRQLWSELPVRRPSQKRRTRVSALHLLFNRMFRGVTFPRYHVVLHVLAFLVFHFQLTPVGSDHFHF